MLARLSFLFGLLVFLSVWWAWRSPPAMVDLTVCYPGGASVRGAEVIWIAEDSLIGRARKVERGVYAVPASSVAVEVVGGSFADALVGLDEGQTLVEVERWASLRVRVIDQNQDPVAGVPVTLLHESLLERVAIVGAWDSKAAIFEPSVRYGEASVAWVEALFEWRARVGHPEAGARGRALDADGELLFTGSDDVRQSRTTSWIPAVEEQVRQVSDANGWARFGDLPESWSGYAMVGTVPGQRPHGEGAAPEWVARLPVPSDPARADPATAMGLSSKIQLDSRSRSTELQVSRPVQWTGHLDQSWGATEVEVRLGRRRQMDSSGRPWARTLAERFLQPARPQFTIAAAPAGPGDLVLGWFESRRGHWWLVESRDPEPGDVVDLGELSKPSGDITELVVRWVYADGTPAIADEVSSHYHIDVEVQPADGGRPVGLELWTDEPMTGGSGSRPARPAYASLHGLPEGQVTVSLPGLYGGELHPRSPWRVDYPRATATGRTGETIELVVPLVKK